VTETTHHLTHPYQRLSLKQDGKRCKMGLGNCAGHEAFRQSTASCGHYRPQISGFGFESLAAPSTEAQAGIAPDLGLVCHRHPGVCTRLQICRHCACKSAGRPPTDLPLTGTFNSRAHQPVLGQTCRAPLASHSTGDDTTELRKASICRADLAIPAAGGRGAGSAAILPPLVWLGGARSVRRLRAVIGWTV
jgi:hypothetical protein